MQSTSKEILLDKFEFVEQQIVFTLETTKDVKKSEEFILSLSGKILYNSTCMCFQTIGETLRQIDENTNHLLLSQNYPAIPWRSVFAMRNVISHEYVATDPEIIFQTIKNDLPKLLDVVRIIIKDIDNGIHEKLIKL